MTYNQEVIRELLNAAFSSSEIRTLAFDRFPEVYADFAAGMSKSQMILMIIERAQKTGRLPDLLDYVKSANPHQYANFAHRLQTMSSPASDADAFGYKQRWQDLQGHIKSELQLLRDYEALLNDTRDPRDRRRYQAEVDRQKLSLANYQHQLNTLETEINTAFASPSESVSLKDVMEGITSLQSQLNQVGTDLTAGQEAIRSDIAQQQAAVLAHIESQHRNTVAVLVKKMDANQLELVDLLLDAADKQQIAQWEAQQLTLLAQQALVDLKRLRQNQPDAAEWQSVVDLLARETGWEQKLKLTVPLIPLILGFESEMKMDVVPALKETWQRLVNKVRPSRTN